MKKTIQNILSEAALQSLFNVISEAVMLIDLNGKVLAANETSARRLRTPLNNLIGTQLDQVLSPDLYHTRSMQVDEVIRSGEQVTFQDRREGRDFANALYPVFDGEKRLVQIAIFSQDITSRLQAEAEQERLTRELEQRVEDQTRALRESEARYRAVAELTSDYIYQASLLPGSEFQMIWSTDSIQRITGYRMGEINDMGWAAIVHPDDLPVIETEKARLLAGFSFTGTMRIIHRQGEERWLQIYSQPVWNKEHSRITSYLGAGNEITARVRAEMKLAKRLDVERALAEIARDFIYTTNIESSILNALTKTCLISESGRARLYLFNPRSEFIEYVYTGLGCKQALEGGSALPVSFRLPDSWRQRLFAGSPIHMTDARELADQDIDMKVLVERLGVSSLLMLPVRSEADLLGCLSLEHFSRVLEWDEVIVNLLEIESQIIGSSLSRLNFFDTLEQRIQARTRHLSALYDLTSMTSQQLDVYPMLEHTIDRVLEAMKSRVGCIHLLDPESGKMVMTASRWISPTVFESINTVSLDDPLWGQIIHEKMPLVIFDLRSDERTLCLNDLQGVQSFIGAPIRSKNQVLGVISVFLPDFSSITQEDITLLAAISDQIGIAVENIRLRKQAEQSAVIEERQRLGRELHDSVTQSLYSMSLFSQVAINYVNGKDFERSLHYLNRMGETTREALKEMRLLIYELRPALLEHEGLAEALRHRLEMVERRLGIDVQFHAQEPLDLSIAAETGLFNIAREALNNALKHSGAQKVVVNISANDHMVKLSVRDNGCGFDIQADGFQPGFGIMNMNERAGLLGGMLKIHSSPGEGTLVEAILNRSQQGEE